LCEQDQLLQEEHEDVLHEVQVLDVTLDFFFFFLLLLVFGFLTIILELSMVRSPHLLIAKINVVVVAKIEIVLEFMVSLKNISELITIS
jgi:hypothetical protein